MEILKKGTKNMAKVWRCKCPLCETEVKIFEGDPDIIRYHNHSGSFREEVTWECPVCGEKVTSATSKHRGSETINLISCLREVVSLKDKETIQSYPGCNWDDENIWWSDRESKWNVNR